MAALVGVLVFHEPMSPTLGAGILCVLGAVLLLRERAPAREEAGP